MQSKIARVNVARKMERETDFITRSGRQDILAVELRRGAGKSRTAHLVPWGQIFQSCNAGKAGVPIREIEVNSPLERKKGAYRIFRLDIVRISGYYDLALESDSLESDQSYEERGNEEFGEGI